MTVNWSEFGRGCAKGLLMILNGFTVVLGLSVFGYGLIDIKVLQKYGEEQATGTFISDLIIIFASLLMVVVAMFGCVSAAKNNAKMLYMYIGFLLIMVILELLVATYVVVQRYGLAFRVTDWMREDFFRNITADQIDQHRLRWDDLQITYECCGLNGPEDYPAVRQNISVSCCPRAYRARTAYAQQQLYKSCIVSSSYYHQGCEEEVLDAIHTSAECLYGVGVMSFWFEVAGMTLAMWLAHNIKSDGQMPQKALRY